MEEFDKIISKAIEMNASDIHITVDVPPVYGIIELHKTAAKSA